MKCTRKYKLYSLGKEDKYRSVYLWECFCGKEFEARSDMQAKSCGCLRHGEEKNGKPSAELKTYRKMKERCFSVNCKDYHNYGGRGITICDRWLGPLGFINFLNDMGRRPGNEYSIERIDVNKEYCPENCKWATKIEQARNTRTNIRLTYNGETRTRVEWLQLFGLKDYVWNHLRTRNKMTNEEILEKLYKEWEIRQCGKLD